MQRDVLLGFEYSYLHDDWVNPLADALGGVTVEEALWSPAPDSKGIWEIVLHMAVWNENIVLRMRSGEPVRPAEGAWPPLPAIPDESAWRDSQRRLWDALASVRVEIESNAPEALMRGPWGLADLLCRFNHNAYHIGQITKLRECMAAQRPASTELPTSGPSTVGGLFEKEPVQWGLRGDPHLWREMREYFKEVPCPAKFWDLASLINEAFGKLTGHPITHPEPFYVEKYSHGGMSSGHVNPQFWRETAIPILQSRLEEN